MPVGCGSKRVQGLAFCLAASFSIHFDLARRSPTQFLVLSRMSLSLDCKGAAVPRKFTNLSANVVPLLPLPTLAQAIPTTATKTPRASMDPPRTPPRQTIRSSATTPPPVSRSNQFRDGIAEEQQQQATVGGAPGPPTVGGTPFLARLLAVAATNNQAAVTPAAAAAADSHGTTSSSAALGEDPFADPAPHDPAPQSNKRPREVDDNDEDDNAGAAGADGGASKKMRA